ncbi:hypothetical protein [Pseudomonas mediterranea]|uniref:hypothetical protein n=1 Tax=Pseudomonas mediterranea TaxID=183795 RepID=UPI00223483F2|nr:hypothetical protein [Pseudomonas mediterranea]UZE02176.1 hypothetical protein LOY71_05960 [Pseudomonas mediterranea]
MRQQNSTFRRAHPSWANACVGENGDPGYVEYSKGFSKAANMLINAVLEDHSIHLTTDIFIYPICFNMRHSVELRLKGAISALQKLAAHKQKAIKIDLEGSHDIYKIWNFFKAQSENLDNRFQPINSLLEPTILDIAEVDPTGQTFRYPFSTQSTKHLSEIALINFVVLNAKFSELEINLDELLRIYEWLEQEYKHGTPSVLHRNQIFSIAKELPNRDEWSQENFTTTKNLIKARFNLSNNALSKILNLIQDHYTLTPRIGLRKPLAGIDTPLLIDICDIWIEFNEDIKNSDSQPDTIITYAELIRDVIIQRDSAWGKLRHLVTPEITAGLHALFYFAYDYAFPEYYEFLYPRYLSEIRSGIDLGQDTTRDQFMHIFGKTNFLHHLIQSLYALSHRTTAEQIIAKHDIAHAFHWLDKARSGELFMPPDFAQYPTELFIENS